MQRIVIIVLLLVSAGLGYLQLRNTQLRFRSLEGKIKRVSRGDLTIPISATGEVGPLSRHQVKSQASGDVIAVYHGEGDIVKAGELLIQLAKDDEQRSVDRAEADVSRAAATLEKAKITLGKLETVATEQAQQRLKQAQARLDLAQFSKEKVEALDKEGRASPDELIRVRSNYDELLAQKKLAEADIRDVKVSIDSAKQEVKLAQALYDQAQATLGDAKERLAETDIYSPVDGMVVDMDTQIGAVIQGGKTTFTAGTVLGIVADISKIYVRAEVDEADIGTVMDFAPKPSLPGRTEPLENAPTALQSGTPVEVRVEAFREEEFEGVIERIHPEPNSKQSSVVTYLVDILLTSDNRMMLLSGMQADVEFVSESATNVVLIPHEAIRRDESDELGCYMPVDIPGSEKRGMKFVPLDVGLDNGMYAEVIEGVKEGDEVYVELPQQTDRDKDK